MARKLQATISFSRRRKGLGTSARSVERFIAAVYTTALLSGAVIQGGYSPPHQHKHSWSVLKAHSRRISTSF